MKDMAKSCHKSVMVISKFTMTGGSYLRLRVIVGEIGKLKYGDFRTVFLRDNFVSTSFIDDNFRLNKETQG